MSFSAGDLKFFLSNPALAVGQGGAQPNAIDSRGGWLSTTEWSNNLTGSPTDQKATQISALFDTISSGENAAAEYEYRCVFLWHNGGTGGTEIAYNCSVGVTAEAASGATVDIALDPTGVVTKTSATQQAAIIANEDTAPAGVSGWAAPSTQAAAEADAATAIGDLTVNDCIALWIRRKANNTASVTTDYVTLTFWVDYV